LRHYSGAFDHDGSWEYEQGYGYVWYPVVPVTWRPYYHGGWSFYGSFGWFWVGGGRWNWPTHHYGRWGVKTGRWYWIPGRHWGPAWVAWASTPGYYGWCPLGFDNRAAISITNVNVYGGRHGNPWHGWTVVPASRFGPRYAVSRYAVAPQSINLSGDRFRTHAQAPARAAAARQLEPLRAPTSAAGRFAVARSRTSAGSVASGLVAGEPTDARPSIARGRGAATTGWPSNPVTTSSTRETSDPGRSSTVRSAGPRPRSTSPSPDAGDANGDDGPGPTRSAVPRPRSAPDSTPAPAGDSGARSGSPSGQSGRSRQPSAPSSGSSSGQARRPSAAWSPPPAPRASPSNDLRRQPSSDRPSAPAMSSPARRIERSAPQRQQPLERRAVSRSVEATPSRAPRAERSAPAAVASSASPGRSPRTSPSSQGSPGSRQARSRNGR
jgi:hypothetical protein